MPSEKCEKEPTRCRHFAAVFSSSLDWWTSLLQHRLPGALDRLSLAMALKNRQSLNIKWRGKLKLPIYTQTSLGPCSVFWVASDDRSWRLFHLVLVFTRCILEIIQSSDPVNSPPSEREIPQHLNFHWCREGRGHLWVITATRHTKWAILLAPVNLQKASQRG